MILKAAFVGLLLWAVVTAIFRFAGHYFFFPDDAHMTLVFALSVPLTIALTWLLLGLIRADPADRAEAAIALAMPGMLLDVYVVNSFEEVLPNLDPMLNGAFGALAMLTYAAILVTGLFLTRIAPVDEQV